MSRKKLAFEEGKKAFKGLLSVKDNPYKYPSEKWFAWFYGHLKEATIGPGSGD